MGVRLAHTPPQDSTPRVPTARRPHRCEVLIHELQNASIRQLELEALEESKKKPKLKAYDPWAAGRQ